MAANESERIREALTEHVSPQIEVIEVFPEIESTSSYLVGESPPKAGNWRVAAADHQTAGRGRMDNQWQSPPLTGLYLSAARTFAKMPNHFSCLTLAIGVSIVEALKHLGVDQPKLKWPNDLVLNNGKLGGILTEMQPGSGAEVTVVIGVGINLEPDGNLDGVAPRIGRIAHLTEAMPQLPSRPVLAASILDAMVDAAAHFETEGFARFQIRWPRYDWLLGKTVSVEAPAAKHYGTVMGIDTDGALLINKGAEMQRVTSGSVELLEERRQNIE